MGLWSLLFSNKIINENTIAPFSEAITSQERRTWFSRTRPWHRVPFPIVDALFGKLDHDPAAFNRFVLTSTKLDLVKQYARMKTTARPGVICAAIAGSLCESGMRLAKHQAVLLGAKGDSLQSDSFLASAAQEALQVAVALESEMYPAYACLAYVTSVKGDFASALAIAMRGLTVVQELKRSSSLRDFELWPTDRRDLEKAQRDLEELVQAYESALDRP